MKIGRKLILSFALLNLVLLALSGIVIKSLGDIDTTVASNVNSFAILEQANDLLASMVSQESGLRGFLLSNNDEFLDVYKAGRDQVLKDLATMKRLTADNPAQQRRIEQIHNLANRWRNEVAEEEIHLMGDEDTRKQAQGEEASGIGKALMDQLRGVAHDFDAAERAVLASRTATRTAATNFAYWSMIVGSLAAIAIAVVLNWLLSSSVAKPVSAMASAMNTLAAGDNGVTIPGVGQKDEIGEMAGAVQSFKDAAIEKLRLADETARARQHAEEERSRNDAVRARAAAEQAEAVQRLGEALRNLASGDLTIRLSDGFSEDYAQIKNDFNEAIDKLKQTMLTVVSSADAIHSGSREISVASDDLSRRTEQQAASLEETAAALDEITATVKKSAEGASHAREVVAATDDDAKRSSIVVRQAVGAMDGIAKSAQQISQIIGVIDEIAFQTNLLALNAGVEAARAGDAGRGFAVVASEVRALAQRSAEAAKEIKGLIRASTAQVDQGVKLVAQTGQSLERIMAQVTEINSVVSDIALAAQEQATGLQQINTAINQMDQVTQQNASMVQESTAAGHALSQETEQLSGLIGRFQVGEATGEALRAQLEKAAPHAFRQPAKAPAGAKGEPRIVASNARSETRNPPARRARTAAKAAAANGADAGADNWEEF
ncbi:MAG TPA: methyl-accepting chemotaxis protein [Roseiarcus sp.]